MHESGIAWDDKSGERLRAWLGVNAEEFYDANQFAIIPMGFCYPGRGKSGDLPPRPECAPLWHDSLFALLPQVQLQLLVGKYAQTAYLGGAAKRTLTETVRSWQDFAPATFPLPHPSPRNNIWLRKNAWFERELVPELQRVVRACLSRSSEDTAE